MTGFEIALSMALSSLISFWIGRITEAFKQEKLESNRRTTYINKFLHQIISSVSEERRDQLVEIMKESSHNTLKK